MSKSKFFRVATEGASTDGRKIERSWIEQMAKNFNPAKYGARVWLEHYRGTVPGGPFDALGDVLAVEARAVEDGKLGLFAQIEPTPALVEMNKKRQKLYTSIELFPEFADTGEAYLTGLAVTDSPASLGTQQLAFTAQRKTSDKALFSEGVEFSLQLEETPATGEGGAMNAMVSMFSKMMEKFTPVTTAPAPAPTPAASAQASSAANADVFAALNKAGEIMASLATQQAKDSTDVADVKKSVGELKTQVGELLATLEKTPGYSTRPAATGGSGQVLADC